MSKPGIAWIMRRTVACSVILPHVILMAKCLHINSHRFLELHRLAEGLGPVQEFSIGTEHTTRNPTLNTPCQG